MVNVRIVESSIEITEAMYGENGFIRIENSSNEDLNIGGWTVDNGDDTITIAEDTIIKKGKALTIPSKSIKMYFDEERNTATLRCPNGTIASQYDMSDEIDRNNEAVALNNEFERLYTINNGKEIIPDSFWVNKGQEVQSIKDNSVDGDTQDELASASIEQVINEDSTSRTKTSFLKNLYMLPVKGIMFIANLISPN